MKRKQIRVTINLNGQNEVFNDDHNQMSAIGFRVLCNITYGFGSITPTAIIKIYGLSLDKMMKLFRKQWNTMGAVLNTVKIEIGEQGGTFNQEYEGNITFAYPDLPTHLKCFW